MVGALGGCQEAMMPRSVLGRLVLGRQRYAMAELGLKLIEGFTRDYMPGERPWDALGLLLIMYKMVKMHQRGRTASSSELSRVCGIPRETLRRKLARLVRLGFVEKRGH